eukprot:TRINITY_DN1132_c0_g1_i6.p1 TRINITY_DN1132_c0_g1~~TRINITY_DN1132_c0_g1_i6.p1  ORF type:complete len:224 (+),score=47.17 TRINITY_DN1132_c0_g1_i6:437-1108(+)
MLYECTNGNVKASLWSFKQGTVPCCTNNDLVPVAAVPWTAMGVPGLHMTFRFAHGNKRAQEEFLVQFQRKSDNAIVCTQRFPVCSNPVQFTKKRNNAAQHSATTPSPPPTANHKRPASAALPAEVQPQSHKVRRRKGMKSADPHVAAACVSGDEIRTSLDNLVIMMTHLQNELGQAEATGCAALTYEQLHNTCAQMGQMVQLLQDAHGKTLQWVHVAPGDCNK